jgi:hypothetical protein
VESHFVKVELVKISFLGVCCSVGPSSSDCCAIKKAMARRTVVYHGQARFDVREAVCCIRVAVARSTGAPRHCAADSKLPHAGDAGDAIKLHHNPHRAERRSQVRQGAR